MDERVDLPEGGRSDGDSSHFRYLKPLTLTPESKDAVQRIWDKLQTQDYAFDDLTRGDSHVFLANLFMPGTEHFLVGEAGYAIASGIVPSTNCVLHFALWDKIPTSELLAAGRELIDYVLAKYQLNRVTAMIPAYNTQATRLAVLLGFRFEGDMRQAILYKGKYHNVGVYGLLRAEFGREGAVH